LGVAAQQVCQRNLVHADVLHPQLGAGNILHGPEDLIHIFKGIHQASAAFTHRPKHDGGPGHDAENIIRTKEPVGQVRAALVSAVRLVAEPVRPGPMNSTVGQHQSQIGDRIVPEL